MAQETAVHRDEVEQLQRRFAEWRGTHAVRSRLPEELWAAAAELARRDGINATVEALDRAAQGVTLLAHSFGRQCDRSDGIASKIA
jgi:hypothetical protein